jgi:CubicO group peptidase (beta-lactamase class C family)
MFFRDCFLPFRCHRIPQGLLAAIGGALLGSLAVLSAQARTVTTATDVAGIVPRLESYVSDAMTRWRTPGVAIGLIAEDRLVYARGFGVRRSGNSPPVDVDTVFQIGSTTKAFLGVTLAQLVADGKIRWNDRVIDHEPEFRMADPWVTRAFRLDDLLAQRSGLPFSTLTNMMLYGYPRSDVIRSLRHIEPVTSFRSRFAYQNAFHLVAERIVARRGGARTWEDFLQRRLLTPLGMTSTSATAEAIEGSPNHATGHRSDTRETVVDPFGAFPYIAGGAGNLNSNVPDLSRWVRLHINGGEIDGQRLIDSGALAKLYEPKVLVDGPIADSVRIGRHDTVSYATGWMIHATPEGRIIEHAGGTIGFVSYIAFDPDRRFGVVVLVNQSALIGHGPAIPLGKYSVDLLQGREPIDYAGREFDTVQDMVDETEAGFAPPADRNSHRNLDAYTGAYESPVMGRVDVRPGESGRLGFMLGPMRLPVNLTPWSGDIFVAHIPLPARNEGGLVERTKLRFRSNADGEIDAFDWLGDGDASGQPAFVRQSAD